MIVALCPQHEIDNLWPRFADRIQKACDRCGGDLSSGVLWQMCRSGNAMLMVAHDGERPLMISVWRFEAWPSGTVLKCLALAGEQPRKWSREAYEFAKELRDTGGAKRFIYEGRNWSRFFPTSREIRKVYEA